jgi:hypothetical protein
MPVVLGQQIGQALCDVLGLPKGTRSFELRCAVDEAVTVSCEYYPSIDVYPLKTALAVYELSLRTGPREEPAINFDAWMNERKSAAHAAMMARHARLARMGI